jgi:hypothetical protein
MRTSILFACVISFFYSCSNDSEPTNPTLGLDYSFPITVGVGYYVFNGAEVIVDDVPGGAYAPGEVVMLMGPDSVLHVYHAPRTNPIYVGRSSLDRFRINAKFSSVSQYGKATFIIDSSTSFINDTAKITNGVISVNRNDIFDKKDVAKDISIGYNVAHISNNFGMQFMTTLADTTIGAVEMMGY